MPVHAPASAMKCAFISRVHVAIDVAGDRNTVNKDNFQTLHVAYAKRGELQKQIDLLHIEFKHMAMVYRLQKSAADLIADSRTHDN